MKLKKNEKLAFIAKIANRDVDELSKSFADLLLKAGFVKDDVDQYGWELKECIDEDVPVSTVVFVIKECTGLDVVNCDVFDSFLACELIGDGDCPECGGTMELWESEGHEIPSGDRDVPPDWKTDWEQWRCPICGHTIEKDLTPDYDDD